MIRPLGLFLIAILMTGFDARAGEIGIGWLGMGPSPERAASILDGPPPEDLGLAGLRLAMADDNASGRFMGQSYRLEAVILPKGGDPAAELERLAAAGIRFIVTGLAAPELLKVTASPKAAGLVFLNAWAADDSLRNRDCRRNLLHTLPSRAMRTDALAQVLVRRNWKKWTLLTGPDAGSTLLAEALRRSARKFGAKLQAEAPWTYTRDAQRTAEGEVAALTRDWSYDVALVADEADEFGDTVMFNTFDPRPVAGSHGLVASAWHPAHDHWGASQLQNRFKVAAGRAMAEVDFAAWAAGRAVGEAAMRGRTHDPARIEAVMRAEDFSLAVFKGRAAGFRPWDGQLRQPMLVAWARAVVAVAPQEGFLHPVTDLDTLGTDKGESACALR